MNKSLGNVTAVFFLLGSVATGVHVDMHRSHHLRATQQQLSEAGTSPLMERDLIRANNWRGVFVGPFLSSHQPKIATSSILLK